MAGGRSAGGQVAGRRGDRGGLRDVQFLMSRAEGEGRGDVKNVEAESKYSATYHLHVAEDVEDIGG